MTSSDKLILALDHGTSGCKVALTTLRGETIDSDFEATPVDFLPGGGAEQSTEDWWKAFVTAANRMLDRGPAQRRDRVAAVACSSTYSSTVAVDADGEALGPALTWLDSRGAPYVKSLMSGWPSISGYRLDRILQWLPKTGGAPTLSGKDDIAHVLYWKRATPEIYRKADKFLSSQDWFNMKLTGRKAASFGSITLFWATDNRDIQNIRYDRSLIDRMGIDPDKLPELMRSTDLLGELSEPTRKALGLGKGVQVPVGAPDLHSACIGSGAVRDYEGHLYVGTSSWLLCHVPYKKTDVLHSIASIPSAIPGRYFCANEQDIAGGCLEWWLDRFLYGQNALNDAPRPDDAFLRLEETVSQVAPGADGLLFAPWLNGERTPVDDHRLRGGFYNLSMRHGMEHMVRAIYEGVALNSRWALKYVQRFIKRPFDSLNLIGGGAQSDAWCQIFADALGTPMRKVADPVQSNARGAALIAAVALGALKFDEIPDLIKIEKTFQPDRSNRKLYDERFREFLAVHKNNRAMYHRMNR